MTDFNQQNSDEGSSAASDGEGMPTEREWLEGLPEDRAAYVNEHGVWIDGSYLIEKYLYSTERQTTGVQWLVYTVKDGALTYLQGFKTRRAAAEFIGGRRG